MKVKLIEGYCQETHEQLEDRINKFILDKEVIDIKYQTAGTYEDVVYSVLILYKEMK